MFDLLALFADTWAFREYPILWRSHPEELPRTTFLEYWKRLSVSLGNMPGRAREVFGVRVFFEAVCYENHWKLNFECQSLSPYLTLVSCRS